MRFFARSIRSRLVLLIVATVVAVVAVHDVAAFLELRRTAVSLANERLDGVASRLGEMFEIQGRQVRQQILTRSRDRAIASVLRDSSDAAARAQTSAALQRVVTTMTPGAELWDSGGRVVMRAGVRPAHDSAYARRLMAQVDGRDSVAIGLMYSARDSLAHGVIARVNDGAGTRGYLVEWRRIATSPDSKRQLLGLIGQDAGVFVGNRDGGVWTDFDGLVDPPPESLATEGLTTYDRAGVGKQLAAARPIPGTPWTILVEFPRDQVYAPVWRMARRLAAITVVLLAAGLVVAWIFGTRLTTPLAELAGAAKAISGGEYTRRVSAGARDDEVGTLATSFNQMAESIEVARRAVEERSEELAHRAEQLSDQATELEMSNEELARSVEETIRTRDDLAAVSAELDASLATAPVGFAFHDLTGRYRRVNACLATLHGVAAEAHVGRLPSEILPDIGPQIEEHVRSALSVDARVVSVELSGTAPGTLGRPRHWLVSVYPIRTSDGNRVGVGSVITDLTAYKQLEQQLLQARKMEAVGRLAGGVAHDFNNILTAIEGFSQFALTEIDDGNNASARQDIEQVLAAANRAGALTRQLLAFSRQQVLQPRVLDLNAVVTGLSPMLARLIGTDIRLKTTTSPSLGAVKADPNQMEQVLVNLVVNARDAMPDGGTVMIETDDVELDASYASSREGIVPGPYVMLAVTDTGMGMDAVTRAQIFDPFFTTKGPREGTGLGLSTVYGIVKQSGGSVEVYSEVGRGTSFKIYLPRSSERADRQTPVRPLPAVPNGQATILLVDDDPHVAATARRALERAGYVVVAAANGKEALRVVEAHGRPFDLVITDLVMPEMGGRELANRLTTIQPGIRVLYTSGYTAEAINQQAVLDLGDAFIGKPFSPDGLLRQVYGILHPVPA
jgi:PAS domain S-box-containing protein